MPAVAHPADAFVHALCSISGMHVQILEGNVATTSSTSCNTREGHSNCNKMLRFSRTSK